MFYELSDDPSLSTIFIATLSKRPDVKLACVLLTHEETGKELLAAYYPEYGDRDGIDCALDLVQDAKAAGRVPEGYAVSARLVTVPMWTVKRLMAQSSSTVEIKSEGERS